MITVSYGESLNKKEAETLQWIYEIMKLCWSQENMQDWRSKTKSWYEETTFNIH